MCGCDDKSFNSNIVEPQIEKDIYKYMTWEGNISSGTLMLEIQNFDIISINKISDNIYVFTYIE